jgi:hypothetical protein
MMCHMTTAMALSMVALLGTDGSRRVALIDTVQMKKCPPLIRYPTPRCGQCLKINNAALDQNGRGDA